MKPCACKHLPRKNVFSYLIGLESYDETPVSPEDFEKHTEIRCQASSVQSGWQTISRNRAKGDIGYTVR